MILEVLTADPCCRRKKEQISLRNTFWGYRELRVTNHNMKRRPVWHHESVWQHWPKAIDVVDGCGQHYPIVVIAPTLPWNLTKTPTVEKNRAISWSISPIWHYLSMHQVWNIKFNVLESGNRTKGTHICTVMTITVPMQREIWLYFSYLPFFVLCPLGCGRIFCRHAQT
jgi:hypothetical protein